MSDKAQHKVALLLFMKERRDILFGKFKGTKETNKSKQEEWVKVEKKARELGVLNGEGKDWQYVRDAIWGNWKGRTLKKIDERKKTGKGGGGECRINDMDKVILDILGRDTPTVSGIGVPDSMESDEEPDGSSGALHCQPTLPKKRPGRCSRNQENSGDDNEHDLKRLKLKLQTDLLHIEKRRQALELFKLETEFDVGPSEFTREFHESCYGGGCS